MIGEFNVFGVFLPSALVWAIAAAIVAIPVRRLLEAIGFYKIVWHRGLFDVALLAILWAAVTALAGGFDIVSAFTS
jgi:hypothetical protein